MLGSTYVAPVHRLYWALATCMRKRTHSETLVKSLLHHYGYAVELIPFYFSRVRANGILSGSDPRPPQRQKAQSPGCNLAMFEPFDRRRKAIDSRTDAGKT